MTTITFDTLKFANRLKAGGFEGRQAEALAEAQADVFEKNMDDLVTKRDLADVEARLESKLEKLELRMTIRLGALVVGSMGILFTALRLLPPPH